MTGQAIISKLVAGNEQFLTTKSAIGDVSLERRIETSCEQKPYAVVLACSDSRIMPEAIFSAGLGELFVVRVAGNIVSQSELASIAFAVDKMGCEVLVVLGHTHCAAIKEAMTQSKGGHIEMVLDEIREAIHNEKDEEQAICLNVLHSLDKIKTQFQPKRTLGVIGGLYHIDTGKVDFITELETL